MTASHRQRHTKPTHLRAVPCPAPKPTQAQDPTPEQLAAWQRLHGYANMPLPEHVESYLKAEAPPQRARVVASQIKPSAPATAQQPQEPLDLWPVIRRIYTGLALVGLVAVIATVWAP
jgi:hypothetical protein